MRILNPSLFNVHDAVLIASIAIIAHYTLLPLYNKISNKG